MFNAFGVHDASGQQALALLFCLSAAANAKVVILLSISAFLRVGNCAVCRMLSLGGHLDALARQGIDQRDCSNHSWGSELMRLSHSIGKGVSRGHVKEGQR